MLCRPHINLTFPKPISAFTTTTSAIAILSHRRLRQKRLGLVVCFFLFSLNLVPSSLLTLAWAHIHRRSLALGSPETLIHGKSSHSSVFIGLRQQDLHQTRTCPRWRPRCQASRCRTGSQPQGATPKASKTKSSARRMSLQTPPVRSRDLISCPESRVFSISGFWLTIHL